MLRSFGFLFLVACDAQDVADTTSEARPSVAVEAPVPEFDRSFEDDQAVAAWQAETLALADMVIHPPDPAAFDKITAAFKITDASVKAYLDAKEPIREEYREPEPPTEAAAPVAKPDAVHAKGLEQTREHYDAGLEYVKLGDAVGAKRCLVALERKGEWRAAAWLAYEMGDKPKLLAELDKMHEREDWHYDMQRIIAEAVADKKVSLAEELATRYAWNLYGGYWENELKAVGDPKIMRRIVERKVTAWIEETSKACRNERDEILCEGPVAYEYTDHRPISAIVEFAKTDRAGALVVAKTYLDSRYSSATECDLGLYKLVKGDAALKAAYLGKIRLAGHVGKAPYSGEGDTWVADSYPGLSYRCLAQIKAGGDKDLISAWSDYLLAVESAHADAVACETDRRSECPFSESIPDKNEVNLGRYVLGIPGGSTRIIDTIAYGEISGAELARVWRELSLPVPPEGSTLTATQYVDAADASLRLKGAGYEAEALKTVQTVLPGAQVTDSLAAISVANRYAAYLLIPTGGNFDLVRDIVAETVAERRVATEKTARGAKEAFEASILSPYLVAEMNEDVSRRRVVTGNDSESPRVGSQEEARALLAPVLAGLAERDLPTYERAIVGLIVAVDDRVPFDEEIRKRTEAGDFVGVTRLLAMPPRNLAAR